MPLPLQTLRYAHDHDVEETADHQPKDNREGVKPPFDPLGVSQGFDHAAKGGAAPIT